MNQEIMDVSNAPLTASAIRAQVNLIQEVMKGVMQEGQHYGKIPGCGEKPTLLKPGAEKLSMVFRLRPIINNDRDIRIDLLENNHKEIHVYCHVLNMDGVELATGVGSCSTMESKFRYRGGHKIFTGQPCPKEYWDAKKAGDREKIAKLIGVGMSVAKNPETGAWEICELGEKMENQDIADVYNTVLKMAKKRAYVDGILSATGASDIFTQDIEDMNPADLGKSAPPVQTSKPETKEPQEAQVVKKYSDIITLSQGEVGDVLDVQGYLISMTPSTTKAPSSYVVGDLPKEHTFKMTIKAFGPHVQAEPGVLIKFHDVKIGEYQNKKQATAKEAVNG